MRVGIVGHGADKFTAAGERSAKDAIRSVLLDAMGLGENGEVIVVSGHSPVGGVDIWAEEIAAEFDLRTDIKAPRVMQWDPPNGGYGFKARNLDIAAADVVHVLVVDQLPPGYRGRVFADCYHCARHAPRIKDIPGFQRNPPNHVKSGACWTGHKSESALKGYPLTWPDCATMRADAKEPGRGRNRPRRDTRKEP